MSASIGVADAEFRAQAESVLHDGESLTGFIEATVRRAVEHRRVQAAFEASARKSLAKYKRSGTTHTVAELFDEAKARVEARRKQVLGA